jgi:ethanolamine utilisation protein eutA
MGEKLLSVGLDVGTTSTQMVVSRLTVENQASAFSVPDMEIRQRELLYQSPVYFTPLLEGNRMDAAALRRLVEQEYEKAGITCQMVDTGAVIVTGESSRTENAAAVMEALSNLAGHFVVAAAGPDLESVLAAKGAGAVDYSERTGETVLHMDIGGGTSNLALIQKGEITATGCMNVGGRLVKLERGIITYVSPVLQGIFHKQVGEALSQEEARHLTVRLAEALEMAAGLRPSDGLLEQLTTREAAGALPLNAPGEKLTLSFSGGVADCIKREIPWQEFGDIGPLLGQAIGTSRLCSGKYVLGTNTIRATVIGAGCHSTQLSGSTVYSQNVQFPLKNIPVITQKAQRTQQEGNVFFALPGVRSPTYAQVQQMAAEISRLPQPIYLCLEQDMAKALGQAMALRLGRNAEILCIDRIRVHPGDYLDVAAPVGPAFPVVVKTLVLQKRDIEGGSI